MRLENILEEYKSSRVSSDCTKKNSKWQIDLFGLECLCNASVAQQNEPYSKKFTNKKSGASNCCDKKKPKQNRLLSVPLCSTHVKQGREVRIFFPTVSKGPHSVLPCYMAFKTEKH